MRTSDHRGGAGAWRAAVARRAALLLLALGGLLGGAACSLPGLPDGTGGAASSAPSGPDASDLPPLGPTPSAGSGSAGAEPAALPGGTPTTAPVAERTGSLENVPVSVAVYPVQRLGSIATLNLRVTSRTGERFSLRSSFNDHDPERGSDSASAPDAVRLLDGVHQKVYLAATTEDGTCLCSPVTDLVPAREREFWVSVTFAAPPADVRSVAVIVPTLGTVDDVPVR